VCNKPASGYPHAESLCGDPVPYERGHGVEYVATCSQLIADRVHSGIVDDPGGFITLAVDDCDYACYCAVYGVHDLSGFDA
jgi:hypothetical protein